MCISHLDQHGNSKADLRIGMAIVLSEIVLIAATSIGPGLLDIFNRYIQCLFCPSYLVYSTMHMYHSLVGPFSESALNMEV